MLETRGLTRYYGPRLAVDDVSFRVEAGEILGFLGPNGAGKTTTMRMLTGYLPPSSGTAVVAGYDIVSQSLEARKCLGYLPENVPLYPEMTVQGYLHFIAKLKQVPPQHRHIHVARAMEQTRVTEYADHHISKLSKGYRQRVGLAQALLGDPRVLILDEPTVGLDPKQIIETRNLIKGLGGEHTVILSTHILPEVSMTCSRVVIINEGRIVAEDTPTALTARLQGSEAIQVEVRGPRDPVASRLRQVPGVQSVRVEGSSRDRARYTLASAAGADVREQVAQVIVSSGWGLLELRPLGLSLEEIFLRLTTSEDAAE